MEYIQSLGIMVQKMKTITKGDHPVKPVSGVVFIPGLERYSLHAEFDQNTMRDSGNVNGIQDCYPERGICQNLGTDVSNFRLHF